MLHRRLLPNFNVHNAKPGIIEPPVKIKPSIDVEILSAVAAETLEDSFVYVHCYLDNKMKDMLIRIWRTTFLVDQHSGSRSKLIHAEKITVAPSWTMVPENVMYNFLLIFSALPKSCQHFDLVEQVPTSGGFNIPSIERNMRDVYHLNISQ
ncbi:MAG TPA: hypothetical protein VD884_17020 [Ohtaekwangia sp.]|nr:hypothetical protein [Ohtaekwangia sp.]